MIGSPNGRIPSSDLASRGMRRSELVLVFVGSTVLFVLLSSRWTEVSLKVVRREVDSGWSKILKGTALSMKTATFG